MPRITEGELITLKLTYQTALSLYQSRIAAISEIELRGEVPSDGVRAEVVTALEVLERAREKYREALFQVAFQTDEIST